MKTMLDKCAVAGDITQAIDRRGAWTCAIVIAGGTESTAVKLQSCDTADGSFSDFKTLIPASEAEADQYKGFVIDLDGAKKFIKVTGATMATCVLGDCDVDVKQVAIKAGEIPSGADLENNKAATIDVSTYTEPVEITPTTGKDGMKKATVTLSNIPSGGGVTAYVWSLSSGRFFYSNIDIAPSDPADFDDAKILMSGNDGTLQIMPFLAEGGTYAYVSDTKFTVTAEEQPITFTRDSTKDFEIWGQ
jgi:hypothetical protein